MTHSSAFTCSPLKQRHAFDYRGCVELMAFTRLDGQFWLPLHLPNNPDESGVHRHFTYYFDSDSGYQSFLQVIYIMPLFFFFWELNVKYLTEFLIFLFSRVTSWTYFPHLLTMLPYSQDLIKPTDH